MKDLDDKLQSTLKNNGYSLTAARRQVFTALLNSEGLTMQQLSQACAAEIDRASVYRSVALFEQLGIAQRQQVGWKYLIELGDSFRPHHHHMYCMGCSMTTELAEDEVLEKRLRKLSREQGFIAQDHQIEIRGLCAVCHEKHVVIAA